MSRIPHTRRTDGRYVFQRRVHYRNIISKIIPMALGTADPKVARARASILSARFTTVKVTVENMLESGPALTGEQIEGIFRRALEEELSALLNDAYANAPWSDSVPDVAASIAQACRLLRRPNRPASPKSSRRDVPPEPWENAHLDGADFYAAQILANLGDEQVAAILEAMGVPVHAAIIEPARTHIIRGMGKGADLAQRAFEDDAMDAADPVAALMTDIGPAREVRRTEPVVVPNVPPAVDSQFQVYDARPFSAVIDDVLADLKADGIWKGDLRQQRKILMAFAWITGDKPLGAYTHLDVAAFKKGIQQLPARGFYFGSFSKGAMSRPFAEVVAELPPMTAANRRNHKTVNRDLSTMATVAKHLATTSWKPRMPGATVMDFGAGRIAIKVDPNIDTRPPWTTAHLEHLFRSPLYTGNGGALNRLRGDGLRCQVWHDAAYYLPLLWFYHHSCREETAGLEVADIIADHAVPHFHIRDNLTRGRDGEMAGEKRGARNRKLPIHAELIRLGFLDYVEAIRAEGHVALFPELYLNQEKRGGAHFYERAWQHMVDYIAERLPLPVNPVGKGPDIHSIRSLGSSFYEVDSVNALMRADVMGHAREGTNGKHYSKRMATEGEDVVLPERRDFIERYVPTITGHIVPQPIRLLPLEKRSRVGAGITRKRRSDAGACRTGDRSPDQD